ncbi:trehalose-phosphatase [Jatrophihabitans sp. DSM 45814]
MHPVFEAIATDPASSLVALDFDGTLAPIVNDPAQSRAVPGAIETLAVLARHGVQVSIVTGRDAVTVVSLGQLERIPGVRVSGLHGAQTWRDGKLVTRAEPSGIAELRQSLPTLIESADPAVWLEDKGLSLVVHTRLAENPQAALNALTEPVTELAATHGLDVVGGKMVLEIRIPGLSKADALEELLGLDIAAAVFGGDDYGDLPAFKVIRDWRTAPRDTSDQARSARSGLTIAVGDVAEVRQAADLHVDTPEDLADLLAELADRLAGGQSSDTARI